jgi:hypothetical protein
MQSGQDVLCALAHRDEMGQLGDSVPVISIRPLVEDKKDIQDPEALV